MAVVLLITPDNGQTIELPVLGKCVIGRSSSADLKIEDGKMSGKHGIFELNSKGQLFYSDLGSTNGSFINNSQIQKVQFKINEVLRLGNTTVIIDEKRLSSKEQSAIGRGVAPSDKTIILPASNGTETIIPGGFPGKKPLPPKMPEQDEKTNQRKSVILNKDLKKKLQKSEWASGKNENVIEQEESSGKTKMLKLDINKIKKKS